MKHTCHAIRCKNPCPPAWLCCRGCWALVKPETQAEVYRTVKLRDMGSIDETWAPWWRAQAQAIYEVAIAQGIEAKINAERVGKVDSEGKPLAPWSLAKWLERELSTAVTLEAMKD